MSTPPAASAQDRVDRLLARAEALGERGQAGAAWATAARAQRRAGPSDPRAALAMARLVEPGSAEQAAEARAALEAHLAVADPNAATTSEARRAVVWTIARGGDLREAVARARAEAGLQDAGARDLLRDLATLAVGQDALDLAREALLGAHRAMPQDDAVLSDLGAVEVAMGRPNDAVARFGRILGRRPDDLGARRDMAGALVAAGRADDACELLAVAIQRHPDDVVLRIELARAAIEARQPEIAVAAARSAAERAASDDGRAHAALGSALVLADDPAGARRAFREALRRDPADTRARQGLDALE